MEKIPQKRTVQEIQAEIREQEQILAEALTAKAALKVDMGVKENKKLREGKIKSKPVRQFTLTKPDPVDTEIVNRILEKVRMQRKSTENKTRSEKQGISGGVETREQAIARILAKVKSSYKK